MEIFLVIADSQNCFELRRVGAEVDELMESDGVEVFRLVYCGKQDEFELFKGVLFKDWVLLEDLCTIG